jgi:hypothetical protein
MHRSRFTRRGAASSVEQIPDDNVVRREKPMSWMFVERMPVFAAELATGLCEEGEPELAAQLSSLRFVGPCQCKEEHCSGFYVEPLPVRPRGHGLVNVLPRTVPGLVILDVVAGDIRFIEVLDRPDVKLELDAAGGGAG